MQCKTPKNRITLIKSMENFLENNTKIAPIVLSICKTNTVFFSVFIFSNL